mmetsp:Transcript_30533/g.79479  ORF Transcript_30533/g.79479 Transcript_30533/m.79479 type:complete len:577 (+) Transcript_30533:39-1769(+)
MDGSQTPSLSNQDFRKLLSTPRPTPAASSTPSRGGSTPKGGQAKSKKPFKPKPQLTAEEEEEASKYRDRAEERRRGINPDYSSASKLASVLGSGGDVDVTKLSMEESKFLGGDLEHTHLVRGLDYALLQKERSRLEKQLQEAEEKAAGVDGEGKAERKKEVSIKHPAARGVYNALFRPPKTAVHEQFLPRRMAFVYDFEEVSDEGFVPDVPTTVRRSKVDCPKPVEAVFAKMDTLVLERIAKIMSYIKTTAGGKKIKKKERDEILGELMTGWAGKPAQQQQQGGTPAGKARAPGQTQAGAAAAQAEDEDIFGDAGTDYRPSVDPSRKKKAPSQQPSMQAHAAAAGGEDMELEEGETGAPPPPPPPPQQQGMDTAAAMAAAAYGYTDPYGQSQWGAYDAQYAAEHQYATAAAHGWPQGAAQQQQQQQQAAAQAAEPKWRVKAKRAEEREVDYVDDAYGEYYPMAAGFEAEVVDEDELEGRKGAAAAAAAAAPSDQGAVDTGKAEALSAKQQASKLQSQLAKIQNIMQRKGQDHKDAFAMPPKEAGTPRRGRGGDSTPMRTGEDPALMGLGSKKRQRI